MRLLPPALALLFAALLPARAGVSVSLKDDAYPFLRKEPSLLEFVEKTLDVESVGWAPVNGRSFSNITAPDRVLPYGFRARPKGQDGPFTFLLVIEQNANGSGIHLTVTPIAKADPNNMPSIPSIPSN